jgi:hypothetical protein
MTPIQCIAATLFISTMFWVAVICAVLIKSRYYRQPMRCWSCGIYFERVIRRRGPINHPEPGVCFDCLNNKSPVIHNGVAGGLGFPLE